MDVSIVVIMMNSLALVYMKHCHCFVPFRTMRRTLGYHISHLQLDLLIVLPINILDRVPLRIPNRALKLLCLLRAVGKQVLLDQPSRRLPKPLEQRKVLVFVCTEDLKNFDFFVIGQVLDEVAHVTWDYADVAGLEVEGAGRAFCSEDCYAGTAFDEEGPFVCVGCLETLAQLVSKRSGIRTYDASAFRG
jgi:hypothetical protein